MYSPYRTSHLPPCPPIHHGQPHTPPHPPQIEPAILRDFGKWGQYTLKDWYATPELQFTTEVQELEAWTQQRLAWMGAALERAASPTYAYPEDNQVPIPGAAAPVAASTAG